MARLLSLVLLCAAAPAAASLDQPSAKASLIKKADVEHKAGQKTSAEAMEKMNLQLQERTELESLNREWMAMSKDEAHEVYLRQREELEKYGEVKTTFKKYLDTE